MHPQTNLSVVPVHSILAVPDGDRFDQYVAHVFTSSGRPFRPYSRVGNRIRFDCPYDEVPFAARRQAVVAVESRLLGDESSGLGWHLHKNAFGPVDFMVSTGQCDRLLEQAEGHVPAADFHVEVPPRVTFRSPTMMPTTIPSSFLVDYLLESLKEM